MINVSMSTTWDTCTVAGDLGNLIKAHGPDHPAVPAARTDLEVAKVLAKLVKLVREYDLTEQHIAVLAEPLGLTVVPAHTDTADAR